MHYIGIDPGKKGAMAIIDGAGLADVLALPSKDGDHDPDAIVQQLQLWYALYGPFHATVEKLRQLPKDRPSTEAEIVRELQKGRRPTGRTPLGGSKANFERGCSTCGFGWMLATFRYFRPNITFEFVSPQTWQKASFAATQGDPKAASLATARRLFPAVRMHTAYARKDNNNFADALLLARYGYRQKEGAL